MVIASKDKSLINKQKSQLSHQDVVKWILRNVKSFLNNGLVFDRSKSITFDFIGYVDYDYTGDLVRRHSISGLHLHFIQVLFLEKHPQSLLQLYLLLRPSMWLQLKVLKKLLGCKVFLLSFVLHKVPQLCFLITRVQFALPRILVLNSAPQRR